MKQFNNIDRKCYTLWFDRMSDNHPWIPEIIPKVDFNEIISAKIIKISVRETDYKSIEIYNHLEQKNPWYVVLNESYYSPSKGVMYDLFVEKIPDIITTSKGCKIIGIAKQPVEGLYQDCIIYCPYSFHCLKLRKITGSSIEATPGFLTLGRDSICQICFDNIWFTITRYSTEVPVIKTGLYRNFL